MDTCLVFFQRRAAVIIWISLVIYLFYDNFMIYNTGKQHRRLRQILGLGLCVSRATATVLNASCALVLLPTCKKTNQLLYRALARVLPRLFFFWLESAKSCHMTLATTLVVFSVIHSAAHFANLWNFSAHYDEKHRDLNFANHKNQNPLELLATQPGLTGVSMLLITVLMAGSSLRCVRQNHYNLFRYTHQLFILFMALLLLHPLSGVLKEELIYHPYRGTSPNSANANFTSDETIFVPIKSRTWMWVSLPLLCCWMDLLWRCCSRNRANAVILRACQLPGRAIALSVSSPSGSFRCRPGQYVLIQCPGISVLEWHPFSVTHAPSALRPYFGLLVRVKGDWTEALEKRIDDHVNLYGNPLEKPIPLLVDGPYPSALESMMSCEVALCVAAGVGVTPFASLLYELLENPRSNNPGRVHMIWIVRKECEISWIAELATKVLLRLRDANRPDRLHLELYITSNTVKDNNTETMTVRIDRKGKIQHLLDYTCKSSERAVLLTPKQIRCEKEADTCKFNNLPNNKDFAGNHQRLDTYIINHYPVLSCRMRFGRPLWDKVFAYWIHLYPGKDLSLYCCGPKKLTCALRKRCSITSQRTKNKISLIHEGFS